MLGRKGFRGLRLDRFTMFRYRDLWMFQDGGFTDRQGYGVRASTGLTVESLLGVRSAKT